MTKPIARDPIYRRCRFEGEIIELVRELGAEDAFDYRSTEPSHLGRFDVIPDTVGKNMRAYRRALGQNARMVAMIIGVPVRPPMSLPQTCRASAACVSFKARPRADCLAP